MFINCTTIKNKAKQLTFILGRPCAGKTTITDLIIKYQNYFQNKNIEKKPDWLYTYFLQKYIAQKGKINIPHFDCLKLGNEIRKNHPNLAKILNNGSLPPTEDIFSVIMKFVAQSGDNIIIDGFPRTLEHASYLKKNIDRNYIKFNRILVVLSDIDQIQKRTQKREYCSICFSTYEKKTTCCSFETIKRQDDTLKIVEKRIKLVDNNLKQIIQTMNCQTDYINNNDQLERTLQKTIKILEN